MTRIDFGTTPPPPIGRLETNFAPAASRTSPGAGLRSDAPCAISFRASGKHLIFLDIRRRNSMKKRLSIAASLLALAASAPAMAGDRHDCIDEACTMVSLIDAGDQGGDTGSASVEAQRFGSWGIDLAGMDRSVKPGDDFFAYVNGTWAKTTPIPSDRSSYGAFILLRDLSEARLRKLVESYPAGDPATGGDQAKVAALYRGFMDEAAAERLDAIPLLSRIAPIYQARTREDLARL